MDVIIFNSEFSKISNIQNYKNLTRADPKYGNEKISKKLSDSHRPFQKEILRGFCSPAEYKSLMLKIHFIEGDVREHRSEQSGVR